MAQFSVNTATGGNSWVYIFNGTRPSSKVNITLLKDKSGSDVVFVVNEDIVVTSNEFGDFEATYKGTIEWPSGSGEKYPVVQSKGSGNYYMVGYNGSQTPANAVTATVAETFTVCFFPGTLIATPSGERKVEELVSGDPVLIGASGAIPPTWFGRKFARSVSVKWIGRQTVSTLFGPAERLMPVRFAAGSLGGGGGQPLLPHSELTVTADHAMLVDGVLCEAGALVNGTTITRVPLSEFGDSYTVYHVETEAHEIILANGAPAETFVDNATRRAFDNYAEFEALHGKPPEMKELPYPRASNARHLPERIKARLGLDHSARRPRRSTS